MEASCYSMDLYCDRLIECSPEGWEDGGSATYTGETWGECAKQARNDGWIFRKDGTHVCPRCSGKRRRKNHDPFGECPSVGILELFEMKIGKGNDNGNTD